MALKEDGSGLYKTIFLFNKPVRRYCHNKLIKSRTIISSVLSCILKKVLVCSMVQTFFYIYNKIYILINNEQRLKFVFTYDINIAIIVSNGCFLKILLSQNILLCKYIKKTEKIKIKNSHYVIVIPRRKVSNFIFSPLMIYFSIHFSFYTKVPQLFLRSYMFSLFWLKTHS